MKAPLLETSDIPLAELDDWRAGGIVVAPSQYFGDAFESASLLVALVQQDTSEWTFPDDHTPTPEDRNPYAIPKGHIELLDEAKGVPETFFAAATREVVEETGLPEQALHSVESMGPVQFERTSRNGARKKMHYEYFFIDSALQMQPNQLDTAGRPNGIISADWHDPRCAALRIPNTADKRVLRDLKMRTRLLEITKIFTEMAVE